MVYCPFRGVWRESANSMKTPFSPPLEFPELDGGSSNLGGTNH